MRHATCNDLKKSGVCILIGQLYKHHAVVLIEPSWFVIGVQNEQNVCMGQAFLLPLNDMITQWEDSHAKLTYLQGDSGAADDEVLEKLERNSAALSIMGWWLCTKAEMQCKSEERMRAELKAASVGELQSRDTLVVSLQRELESSTELIQEQDSLQSELHPQRELALQKEKLEELVANAADALKKKSTVLSVMLWWLHDKAEKSGLQEEMLRVQLCSSHEPPPRQKCPSSIACPASAVICQQKRV
jgi:hypothetical protein